MVTGRLLSLTAAAIVVVQLVIWKKRVKRLPPGPRKLPFIDNLLNMPGQLNCFKFIELCQEHNSDIVHFSALGTSIVILNNHELARDLFEKRSGLYSSRMTSQILHNLSPGGLYFAMSVYGDWWRACRRMFVQHFDSDANAQLHQQREVFYVRRYLAQLLASPEDFRSLTRHLIGSIIMSRTYGTNPHPIKDSNITMIEDFGVLASSVLANTHLVDVFPFLRHLPTWFPGTGFHKIGQEMTRFSTHVRDSVFDAAKKAMESPDALPSFVSDSLQEISQGPSYEQDLLVLKYTAAQIYVAGADTSASALSAFFLAMILYPNVQKKLQAELDAVLHGRLPSHEDVQSLPYLSAVVMEVLRWWPVVPLGLPHASVMDDVYEGYFIPKGTILIANQRSILHNPRDYPEPGVFKPERFLKDGKIDKSVRDPSEIAFGYGRRVCPGEQVAKSVLTIAIASVASMFHLSKKTDANGQEIEPSQEYDSAFICHPKEFPCIIKPRTPQAAEIIRSWALEEDPDLIAIGKF